MSVESEIRPVEPGGHTREVVDDGPPLVGRRRASSDGSGSVLRRCSWWATWATIPDAAEPTMRECAELGITMTWMHRAFGQGSVDDRATAYGRDHGITVIDGGCPLMFEPASDFGHKIIKLVCSRKIPKSV